MLIRLDGGPGDATTDLLFEVPETGGRKAPVDSRGVDVVTAERTATSAVKQARHAAGTLLDAIRGLDVDEAEISFGLKMTGEAGLFAITRVGGEAQCTVRLKWSRPA